MHSAILRIAYKSRSEAEIAAQAVAPDHNGLVQWKVEDTTLVLNVRSTTTLGLVRSVDDVLGCLRALEPDRPSDKAHVQDG